MKKFEWDIQKAAINLEKHGISFEEASKVFDQPNAMWGRFDTSNFDYPGAVGYVGPGKVAIDSSHFDYPGLGGMWNIWTQEAPVFDDIKHSERERREHIIGKKSENERLWLICFTRRSKEVYRIISARKANQKEKAIYEEYQHTIL